MKIDITKEEYSLLRQVLDFPIGMFHQKSANYFFDKFGVHESELEKTKARVDKFENNLVGNKISLIFSDVEYAELVKCYKAAKLYFDPVELPTVTGYSWEEAEKLELKLGSQV